MRSILDEYFETRSTDRLRRTIELSWKFVDEIGVNQFDTRHLLFGAFAKANGVAYYVLANFGVTYDSLRQLCAGEIFTNTVDPEAIHVDPEVKLAINDAIDAARMMRHGYFGTEHLLIGLTKEGLQSTVVLRELGLEPNAVRSEVYALLGHAM